MRVSVDSTDVKVKSGTSAKGKPYTIATQVVYIDTGKRYPAEGKTRLADPEKPWPVGEYTIDFDESSFVGQFGSLQLSEELVLIPMGDVAKADASRAPTAAKS